jgi:hypothetical protein
MPLHSDDPLLTDPVAVVLRTGSRVLGWSSRRGEEIRLTRRGYDRYHDLERWVTYHLIEPLWSDLMAEHDESPATTDLEATRG